MPSNLPSAFNLTPEQALDWFKAKGLAITFDWRDMIGQEHERAFTIAKMLDVDLLKTARDAVESAIANGDSFHQFKKDLVPELQKAGWWGKKTVVDPQTGQAVNAQLGSPHRLATIFRTNLQTAYAAGQWEEIERTKASHPWLMYDAVDDHRTRPEHASWDGLTYPADDAFWRTHYPPNGWNCRCTVIQLTDEQAASLGKPKGSPPYSAGSYKWTNPRTGKTYQVPNGLDPGWDHHHGKNRVELLLQTWAAKQRADDLAAKTALALAKAKKTEALETLAELKKENAQLAAATRSPLIERIIVLLDQQPLPDDLASQLIDLAGMASNEERERYRALFTLLDMLGENS